MFSLQDLNMNVVMDLNMNVGRDLKINGDMGS